MAKGKTTFSIREKLDLLEEASDFFQEVGNLTHDSALLHKAVAIGTVRHGLLFAEKRGMDLEKDLDEAMTIVIDEETINHFIEVRGIEGQDEEFYKGGFGFAVGILQDDEKTYDDFRALQEEWYEDILPELKKSLENE